VVNAFEFLIVMHELMHIWTAHLLRVHVSKVVLSGQGKTYINIDRCGRFKESFIAVSPHIFDLFFYLRLSDGYLRVFCLKFWFACKRKFVPYVLDELRL